MVSLPLLPPRLSFLSLFLLLSVSLPPSFPAASAADIETQLAALQTVDTEAPASYDPEASLLAPEYAESAMPGAHGRKTVLIGGLLILMFLLLTKYRLTEGSAPENSYQGQLAKAQAIVAKGINTPVKEINIKLEREGKALSARLAIYVSAAILVGLGMVEILMSAIRRAKHKRKFKVLGRARSLKMSSLLMLLLGAAAVGGLVLGWDFLGNSVYF